MVIAELALDIPFSVYNDTYNVDYALGRAENLAAMYSYTMARDAMARPSPLPRPSCWPGFGFAR